MSIWKQLLIGGIPPKPLLLIDIEWTGIPDTFPNNMYVTDGYTR